MSELHHHFVKINSTDFAEAPIVFYCIISMEVSEFCESWSSVFWKLHYLLEPRVSTQNASETGWKVLPSGTSQRLHNNLSAVCVFGVSSNRLFERVYKNIYIFSYSRSNAPQLSISTLFCVHILCGANILQIHSLVLWAERHFAFALVSGLSFKVAYPVFRRRSSSLLDWNYTRYNTGIFLRYVFIWYLVKVKQVLFCRPGSFALERFVATRYWSWYERGSRSTLWVCELWSGIFVIYSFNLRFSHLSSCPILFPRSRMLGCATQVNLHKTTLVYDD